MLVDDHEGVREATAGMLRDMGHAVETAADGATMLRTFKKAATDYDLIITDYAMPLLSGCDMLNQAREIRPDIPGIIISGYSDSGSIACRPGELVVLSKPFTDDGICAAICSALSGKMPPSPAAG